MSDYYMSDYWRGGTATDKKSELVKELADLLGGIAYTQTCTTSAGKTYKKLVIEYEDSANN